MVRLKNCLLAECYRLLQTRWLLLTVVVLLLTHGAFCYVQTERTEPGEINEYYAAQLQALITRTENNLDTMEPDDENSLSAQYNRQVLAYCLENQGLSEKLPVAGGWDDVLIGTEGNWLLLLCLAVLAIVLFYQDQEVGIRPILRSVPSGRACTYVSRLFIYLLFCVVISAGFTLVAAGVVALKNDLVGLVAPMQAYKAFVYCPRVIPILVALIESTLMNAMIGAVIGLMVAWSANLLDHPIISMILTALVCVSQMALGGIAYRSIFSPLQHCNLISAMRTADAYRKLTCVQIGDGALWNARPVIVMLLCILLTMLIALTYHACHVATRYRRHRKVGQAYLRAIAEKRAEKRDRHRVRPISLDLIRWELRKLVADRKIALLMLLLVVLKAASMGLDAYQNSITYQEKAYREYMIQLQGPVNEQTALGIAHEKAALDEAAALRGQLADMKNLSEQEAQELWRRITEARRRENSFDMVVAYYDSVLSEPDAVRRADMSMLYDTGWLKLFGEGYDVWLFLLTALFSAVLFTQEEQKGFHGILYTTKEGRRPVRIAKLTLAILFSGGVSALFFGADVLYIGIRYSLPHASAALMSLGAYRHIAASWSLGGYLAAVGAVRMLSCVVFTLLFSAVSIYIRRGIVSLIIPIILVPVPQVVTNNTLDILRPADFLDGNAVLCRDGWQSTISGIFYVLICVFLLTMTLAHFETQNAKKARKRQ